MRDPHVTRLRYRLAPAERTTYAPTAPPVAYAATSFTARLEGGVLVVEMVDHYATEEEARSAVEPALRAWEILAALNAGRPQFEFEFDNAELIDRDPPPPGAPKVVHGKAALSLAAAISARASVEHGVYPPAPIGFVYDPDVETLYGRWRGYLEGREPLQSMAYFCLTVIKSRGGAARYSISAKVLETMGRLATEPGDSRTARKITTKLRPLQGSELAWLEAAVKEMIRRAGEVAASPDQRLAQITMADLPPLT